VAAAGGGAALERGAERTGHHDVTRAVDREAQDGVVACGAERDRPGDAAVVAAQLDDEGIRGAEGSQVDRAETDLVSEGPGDVDVAGAIHREARLPLIADAAVANCPD